MKHKVFINGSISIKELPQEVKKSIDKIIEQNFEILVGDARGVDALVQNYCLSLNYYNVTIYSIYKFPRYKVSDNFKIKYIAVPNIIKRERERQQEKDKAMTLDSEFTFTIWDSKSKGSYSNILRGLDNHKKVKIYLYDKSLSLNKITNDEIESIYRKNNGYTASEVIQYFKIEVENIFQKTQDLYKYLMNKLVIQKENKIYRPTNKYENLFIIDKYKGKIKGVKFKDECISWIEKHIKEEKKLQQTTLF